MKSPALRTISLTALFSVLGAVLLQPSVFAQDNAPDRPGMHGGRMHGPMGGPRGGRSGPRPVNREDRIEHLDSNGDGKISLDEFVAPRLARIDDMFERRDVNDDGVITEGEGRPERAANAAQDRRRPGPGARGRPDRSDIDRDALEACVRQTIPSFELPERPDAEDIEDRFDTVDTNGDGKLSLAEVTAAVQAGAETRFDKLDSNADGFITTEELAAQQTQRQEVREALRTCARDLATG